MAFCIDGRLFTTLILSADVFSAQFVMKMEDRIADIVDEMPPADMVAVSHFGYVVGEMPPVDMVAVSHFGYVVDEMPPADMVAVRNFGFFYNDN